MGFLKKENPHEVGWMEFIVRKKATIIFQPYIVPLITKSEAKKNELYLNDTKIKEIMSAGSSLTRGILKKS